ncbi:MAG: tRNA (adenosine(37)-N6)-threonylcarbamoyltransferase complex dimerization subunit type 1 TsaB [Oscillibacter sp.]|jgi:tRNA threonylcarbamoyladenosine biosynthesis protein TsaB|nr:tRNA (adenosine(37)-N6)-threonylcarbamoyltransferase complex dimerization subunit type 1 TsaB [Oscillibacter sp.]
MRILALETSAKACSAAVTEDGRVAASAFQCTALTHSRTLMPMVQAMLKNAELTVDDCDAVAVANGPGSFTGIRIGIAAAKGLAFAADKPAVGVSTLEAMALGCAGMDGLVVCAMDARRQQVYNAVFESKDGVLSRRTPDRPIGLAELAEELKNVEKRKIIVGDGALLCYNYLLEHEIPCVLAPSHLLMQSAVTVALAAEAAVREGRSVTAQELAPVYLRAAQADRLKTQ